jgi:hypothetical protein
MTERTERDRHAERNQPGRGPRGHAEGRHSMTERTERDRHAEGHEGMPKEGSA